MASAFDVAEYLLSKADATENDMTHMKLQKLLYYDSATGKPATLVAG